VKPGPRTAEQLGRLRGTWKQGEHILISGATGSGKTALARHLDQIRINRKGHVVVMVCKLTPDQTILDDYAGWTRWTTWKKRPSPHENRVLLMPDTSKEKTIPAMKRVQREVFAEAMDSLSKSGKWTLHVDEGLYMCSPSFLNLGDELGMLHAMGRSSNLTIITLAQRPSHIPLIIYSSASHAFIGRTRETVDLKRLAELGGRQSAKELHGRIDAQEKHDFLWVPVGPDWDAEPFNLKH